jgi:hypothetical protein
VQDEPNTRKASNSSEEPAPLDYEATTPSAPRTLDEQLNIGCLIVLGVVGLLIVVAVIRLIWDFRYGGWPGKAD